MQKNYPSIRVFENPLLEQFTHVHPITPLLVWAPVVATFLWRSVEIHELPLEKILGIGAGGFVFWTLTEYLLHRFAFHYVGKSAFAKRIHFLLHGIHHDDPQDPTRLLLPPAPAMIFATLFYVSFRVVLGPVAADPFFAFFIFGYLCYDYIHFSTHHFRPRTWIGAYLKKSHMSHHYVCPNSRWGVSSPFWDYVFGTLEAVASEKGAKEPVRGLKQKNKQQVV